MNNLSTATLVVIVTALSEKVEGQGLMIDGLGAVLKESDAHIRRDHEEMDEMQRTITDLREQLEVMEYLRDANERQRNTITDLSYRVEESDRLRNQNTELWETVRKLKSENYKLRFGGQSPDETSSLYMVAEGTKRWVSGDKIGTIKVVREVSGWGLKETKDWCEAYIARQAAIAEATLAGMREKEETPSGTQRSSQLPAGVGDQARKSA